MSGSCGLLERVRIIAPLPDTLTQGRTTEQLEIVSLLEKVLPCSEMLAECRKSFAIGAANLCSDCDRGFFNSPTVTYFTISREMVSRSTVAFPGNVVGR